MSNIFFKPWVGSKYHEGSRFGVRVLVLGESHYGTGEVAYPAFTQDVVKKWAKAGRLAFFTKIANVLLNRNGGYLDDATRNEIWDHVAFYNYIQELVGEGARIQPSEEMWTKARIPLQEILSELEPDVVLVLGERLAYQLSDFPDKIEVCRIRHPSASSFSYEQPSSLFAEAVERARAKSASAISMPA